MPVILDRIGTVKTQVLERVNSVQEKNAVNGGVMIVVPEKGGSDLLPVKHTLQIIHIKFGRLILSPRNFEID